IPPHRNTANTDSPPNSRPPLHRSHYRGTSNSGDPPTTAWQAQGVPSPRHKTSRIAARTVPSSPHSLSDTADVKGSVIPSTTPPQNVVLAFLVFSTSSNHQLLCLPAHFLAILPSLCAAVAPICFALLHFFRADYLVAQGTQVVAAQKRRWVDPHWLRGNSYLRIGWQWVKSALARGWELFATLHLSGPPDPEPCRASASQPTAPLLVIFPCRSRSPD